MFMAADYVAVLFFLKHSFHSVNSNVDLIVSATQTFKKLGLKPSKTSKNYAEISSLEQLEECFSHHFKKCAAAERFVTSKEIFDKIVDAAIKVEGSQVIVQIIKKFCISRKSIHFFLIQLIIHFCLK